MEIKGQEGTLIWQLLSDALFDTGYGKWLMEIPEGRDYILKLFHSLLGVDNKLDWVRFNYHYLHEPEKEKYYRQYLLYISERDARKEKK